MNGFHLIHFAVFWGGGAFFALWVLPRHQKRRRNLAADFKREVAMRKAFNSKHAGWWIPYETEHRLKRKYRGPCL